MCKRVDCSCGIGWRTTVIMVVIFFFNDTATTEIYTLSLHDALPISLSDAIIFYSKVENKKKLIKFTLKSFVYLI